MKKVAVSDIQYDTDAPKDLPAEAIVYLPDDYYGEIEDIVADDIADHTGWLVESFCIEGVEDVQEVQHV